MIDLVISLLGNCWDGNHDRWKWESDFRRDGVRFGGEVALYGVEDVNMCRKAECAYLRANGYCLMHREACGVECAWGECADGVERVSEYAHMRQVDFMNRLRIFVDKAGKKGACLHSHSDRECGFAVFKTCTSKSRFATVERARKAAIGAERRQGLVLAVYECPYCHGYHLTRQLRRTLLWRGNEELGLPA